MSAALNLMLDAVHAGTLNCEPSAAQVDVRGGSW
jgi:hypothetical protein